jgi:hypothetical protein
MEFWHYQKGFEAVQRENATFLDRSVFIGAYFNDELIGFIKMVAVGTTFATLQVISKKRHSDKKPMNALIGKAVQICEAKGVSHLVYGSFTYNGHYSSLTEFKRRNGFEQVNIPRYYVPLSIKGHLALRANLHRGLAHCLPASVVSRLRALRTHLHGRRVEKSEGPATKDA